MSVPLTQSLQANAVKRDLAKQFRAASLETPDLDARLLVMAAAGLSHADLIAHGDEPLSLDISALIKNYARRRLAGEPIDHILGYREFYGRRFKVTKDVLSPRPETELLVETALAVIQDIEIPRLLDLGTGSGAILISILAENPNATGMAIDISEAALVIAKENAQTHNITDRITFASGSWFNPAAGGFDLIVSNPPYITDKAMALLHKEVADFDPDEALSGGEDGLDAFRAIIRDAHVYLEPNGHLILEIGFDQGPSVSNLLELAGFRNIRLLQDLAGHDRVTIARV